MVIWKKENIINFRNKRQFLPVFNMHQKSIFQKLVESCNVNGQIRIELKWIKRNELKSVEMNSDSVSNKNKWLLFLRSIININGEIYKKFFGNGWFAITFN